MRIRINTGVLVFLAACTGGTTPDGGPGPGVTAHYPPIPNGGGPTLSSARVVAVTYAGDTRASELQGFLSWLAGSSWLTEAGGEYGVQSVESAAPVTLSGTLSQVLMIDDVKALIAGATADGGLPTAAPGAQPYVYVWFVPDGTAVVDSQGNLCRTNPGAGAHDVAAAGGALPFVVIPFCPARFSATLSQVQSAELDAARLLLDTLTDPSPHDAPAYGLTDTSSPWTSMGAEAGDFCYGRLFTRDAHTLQRAYSNRAAAAGGDACVPASSTPGFGVTVSPATLQMLSIGQEIDFTVTGWAQQKVDDWTVHAAPWVGDFAITAQLDRSTLNDGQTAKLSVSVPFAVPHGTYGAVLIQSSAGKELPRWPVSFVVQ